MLFPFFLSLKFMWKNFLGIPLKHSKLMVGACSSNLNLIYLLRILLVAYHVHTLVPKAAPHKESTATLSRPASLFWPDQIFHSITGLMLSKPSHCSSIECPPPSSKISPPNKNYFIKYLNTFPYAFLVVFAILICVHTKLISLIFGPVNMSS